MAFGPVMSVKVGDLTIELAPITKDVLGEFVKGMSQASVTQYIRLRTAPTLEDELEWYDKARASKTDIIWGIWLVEGNERTIIGNTALTDITHNRISQATSGSLIFRQECWGRGIASAIHKARTWYAFQHLGLHRVNSAVVQDNKGSRKALERSGYSFTHVERNTDFVDGALRHQDNLECLNPADPFWSRWWGRDKPPKRSIEARKVTREAMDWAKQHVKLL